MNVYIFVTEQQSLSVSKDVVDSSTSHLEVGQDRPKSLVRQNTFTKDSSSIEAASFQTRGDVRLVGSTLVRRSRKDEEQVDLKELRAQVNIFIDILYPYVKWFVKTKVGCLTPRNIFN